MKPRGIPFSRLALAEQKALGYMRGELVPMGDNRRRLSSSASSARLAYPEVEKFVFLRRLAALNDMHIQPCGSKYVNDDELTLLNWLAVYQRVSGLQQLCHQDVTLALTLAHCAGALSNVGLRLAVKPA